MFKHYLKLTRSQDGSSLIPVILGLGVTGLFIAAMEGRLSNRQQSLKARKNIAMMDRLNESNAVLLGQRFYPWGPCSLKADYGCPSLSPSHFVCGSQYRGEDAAFSVEWWKKFGNDDVKILVHANSEKLFVRENGVPVMKTPFPYIDEKNLGNVDLWFKGGHKIGPNYVAKTYFQKPVCEGGLVTGLQIKSVIEGNQHGRAERKFEVAVAKPLDPTCRIDAADAVAVGGTLNVSLTVFGATTGADITLEGQAPIRQYFRRAETESDAEVWKGSLTFNFPNGASYQKIEAKLYDSHQNKSSSCIKEVRNIAVPPRAPSCVLLAYPDGGDCAKFEHIISGEVDQYPSTVRICGLKPGEKRTHSTEVSNSGGKGTCVGSVTMPVQSILGEVKVGSPVLVASRYGTNEQGKTYRLDIYRTEVQREGEPPTSVESTVEVYE